MASNQYPYNYQNYQQNSTQQQYSGYQPAPNNVQHPPRQPYQHASQAATTQGNEYMNYSGPAYSTQSNTYADNTWTGSNYGGNRDTTSRAVGAAEALRNMSNNNAYGTGSTATAQQAFGAADPRYGNSSPAQNKAQPHAPQTYAHSEPQAQPRPRSVNTHRAQHNTSRGLPSPATATAFPSQRAQTIYNQQQHPRPASPADTQTQFNRNVSTSGASVRSAAITAASQYNQYNHRQLPSVDMPRTNQTQSSTAPNMNSYGDVTQAVPPVSAHSAASNAPINGPGSFNQGITNQGTITVDPMAVYDPWPQYQRQQEEILKRKAAEDAERAEEERKAEKSREAEEQRKEEAERMAVEEQRVQQAAKPKKAKAKAQNQNAQNPLSNAESPAGNLDADGDGLEAEIRAMMAKMRELNGKDPALLARIWEEERRAKAPSKSPTVQSANVQGKASISQTAAQPAQANQRKKAAPKDSNHHIAPPNPQPPAAPVRQTPILSPVAPPAQAAFVARPTGNTVWPPEKKIQLAEAAVTYLTQHNPGNSITVDRVLGMLNGNPSYVQLCEQLEQMGLRFDRGVFAKKLLNAVPDVNAASKLIASRAAQPSPMNASSVQRAPAPMAVLTKVPATPTASTLAPANGRSPYPGASNGGATTVSSSSVPVAEMVVIKPELKPPANKEEAARKRNFNDLIDLTMLDEDDIEPPPKKANFGIGNSLNAMDDATRSPANNFPVVTPAPPPPYEPTASPALPPHSFQIQNVVDPLDKKKALRRNGYNAKTIARDVLLACGRHPSERQLNGHLEILKTALAPQVSNDSDLSTLRWDLIDPGQPPLGFYRASVQALAEDADDEDESEDEAPKRTTPSESTSGGARVAGDLPSTNPFQAKGRRGRGRPPRHSYDGPVSEPKTPSGHEAPASMSASDPRPSNAAAGVGYSAFRSATQYGPDGNPLPKKKGRPVGWRKAIHGSAAAQARSPSTQPPSAKPFTPSQPSGLRHVHSGGNEPITIRSRSNSVANHSPKFPSFKCQWQNCKAELHNLETLKKHVSKLHVKETGAHECLWSSCGREVTDVDPNTNMRFERHLPLQFDTAPHLREHLALSHFGPLGWQQGDGPTSGLSDAHESDTYLSDTHGRRVTPRVVAEESPVLHSSPRRGRPPKSTKEQEAADMHARLVAHKKRVGGPGMDRGGATLANDKRRKGFLDGDQTEEELVDVED